MEVSLQKNVSNTAGVTRIALVKRTLGERYVLETDGGDRATFSHERDDRWPTGRTLGEGVHQSGGTRDTTDSGAWIRIRIR